MKDRAGKAAGREAGIAAELEYKDYVNWGLSLSQESELKVQCSQPHN